MVESSATGRQRSLSRSVQRALARLARLWTIPRKSPMLPNDLIQSNCTRTIFSSPHLFPRCGITSNYYELAIPSSPYHEHAHGDPPRYQLITPSYSYGLPIGDVQGDVQLLQSTISTCPNSQPRYHTTLHTPSIIHENFFGNCSELHGAEDLGWLLWLE
jgi:hypothetical protein